MPAAIVTGSDSGIGRATAVALAQDGFDVGVTYNRDEDGARGTAEEVEAQGQRAAVAHLDLTSLPGAADRIDKLADELGGVDVLVNCSGMGVSSPFLDLDWADWRAVLDVDLNGA
ncbi:MAG TPA: SDR family NAD(P)-dependent oxidoreductase, partial [Gaiellales bacterium]|nr:SDR family NAD(P)-dependent oxidoreductase [Gaiellales bacterium]